MCIYTVAGSLIIVLLLNSAGSFTPCAVFVANCLPDVVFCRFMEPGIIAILGGVLPFGSIFIEMYVSPAL